MRLILARHGSVDARPGCYWGRTDLSLSAAGRRQAVDLGRRLALFAPCRCLCSPLRRARETARLALEAAGWEPDLVIDPRLAEVDFGRWEGLRFAEIAAAEPEAVTAWGADVAAFRFPEGEANGDFAARVRAVLDSISGLEEDVLVVAHGGVIRFLICLALGLDLDNYLLFKVEPAAMTVIELHDQGGVLAGLNQ